MIIYYVVNSYEGIYMEIKSRNHVKAGSMFKKTTGKRFTVIYQGLNWIRPCGKTQAEKFDWKKISLIN